MTSNAVQRPQIPGALRVAAAWARLRCSASSTMSRHRLDRRPLHPGPRRSQRDPRDFHHGLLGRVSLNPLVGYATGMPVFGWAKPVPVNPLNLKNPKTDHLFIAAAGPASNIIAAAASLLGLKLITVLFAFQLATGHAVISPLSLFFYTSLMINVVLAVFNLIPIPPLDGSWILSGLLSDRFSALMDSIRPYSFVLLILLLFSGVLGMVFHPILSFVRQLAL